MIGFTELFIGLLVIAAWAGWLRPRSPREGLVAAIPWATGGLVGLSMLGAAVGLSQAMSNAPGSGDLLFLAARLGTAVEGTALVLMAILTAQALVSGRPDPADDEP